MLKKTIVLLSFLVVSFAQADVAAPTTNSRITENIKIVVIGSQYEESLTTVWAPIDKITGEDMAAAPRDNIGHILNTKSSLFTIQQGSPGLVQSPSIRGFTSARILVLVDDMPINSSYTGGANLSVIAPEIIDHIEILKTGGSSLYGPQAMGGVIKIYTKDIKAEGEKVFYSTETNTILNNRLSIGYQNSWDTMSLYFTGGNTSGPGHRDNSDFSQDFLLTRYQYQLKPNVSLFFNFHYLDNTTGVPGPMPPEGVNGEFSDNDKVNSLYDKQDDTQQGFNTGIDFLLSSQTTLAFQYSKETNNLFYDAKYMGWEIPTSHIHLYETNIDAETNIHKIQLNHTWQKHSHSVFGYESQNCITDLLEKDTDQYNATTSQTNNHYQTNMSSLWTNHKFKLLNLYNTLGVRFDSHSHHDEETSWHIGTNWHLIEDNLFWKTSCSKSFRPPNISEMAYSNANIDQHTLEAEHACNFSTGLIWQYSTKSNVSAEIFTNAIEDMIVFTPSSNGFYYPENIEKGTIAGYELATQHQWTDIFTAEYGLTILEARQERHEIINTATLEFQDKKRTMTHIPEIAHTLKLAFTPASDLLIVLTGRYTGERKNYYADYSACPVVTYKTKKIAEYTTWDIFINKNISTHISIFARCENITDEEYSEQFGSTYQDRNYPVPPRTITLGLRGTF